MLWRNKFTALVNLSKKICQCSNSRKLQDTGSWRTAQFQTTLLALHTRVCNTKLLQCGTDAWELLKTCSHIYMGNTGTIPQTLNWSLVLLQNLTFRKHLQVNQASASIVLYRCGSPVWNQMSDFFLFQETSCIEVLYYLGWSFHPEHNMSTPPQVLQCTKAITTVSPRNTLVKFSFQHLLKCCWVTIA